MSIRSVLSRRNIQFSFSWRIIFSFTMAIKNALQLVSRWLARNRKGLGEQASSSGAGGSAAEPISTRETVRQLLIVYAVMRIYGPNGLMFQLIDKAKKEGKEATDLPK